MKNSKRKIEIEVPEKIGEIFDSIKSELYKQADENESINDGLIILEKLILDISDNIQGDDKKHKDNN